MEAKFNFLQVKQGITYFTQVTVRSDPLLEGVKVFGAASAALSFQNPDWLEAARVGVEKVLKTHLALGGNKTGLEVTAVLGTEVDTRRNTVEVAAFCAGWKALGRDESELKIEFDGSQWKVR